VHRPVTANFSVTLQVDSLIHEGLAHCAAAACLDRT